MTLPPWPFQLAQGTVIGMLDDVAQILIMCVQQFWGSSLHLGGPRSAKTGNHTNQSAFRKSTLNKKLYI